MSLHVHPSSDDASAAAADCLADKSVCAIGLDVGGTKIAGGLLSVSDGQILARRLQPTGAERGGRAVLNDVFQLASELAAECADRNRPARAVGLGVCELVDREGRQLSANRIAWMDLPVREELSKIAPTVLEADVRAAALAESAFGAGQPFREFLYVTVGTGISCCLMVEGSPHLGARGLSGTMASSPLAIPCERCGHMNRRSLEDLAAGPALVERFRAAGGSAEQGQDVLRAAAEGDRRAEQIVQSAGEALESQIALLVNTLDPEAVVVGGGLGLSTGPFWEHFIAATRRNIWSDAHRDLPILRAATGTDAGWIGAALRAWQAL
ncbi:MAG: ROK family protein [Verrucomicrobia bacterium]|nr:ROK family protein [Verrucomicrobiota bacterium]